MDKDKTRVGLDKRSSRLPVGALLDNYRIERLLGEGSMGQVYEVEHVRMGKRFALKVLPPELHLDPEFERRFEQETRTLAGLEHKHIVTIYNAGETTMDGMRYPFLAMELLKPFSAWFVEQGSLGEACVYGLLQQVLDALAYAHGRGVIHRDLKPANLLMDAAGNIKVADFGVAQVMGSDYMRTLVSETVARSRLGSALTEVSSSGKRGDSSSQTGTVYYMAPEVVEGKPPTARSDLYAIGVMAYEWLTGRKPIGRVKAVAKLRPDACSGWDGWIDRLLDYDPAERFADVNECLEGLGGILAARQTNEDTVEKPLSSHSVVAVTREQSPQEKEMLVSEREDLPEVLESWQVQLAEKCAVDMKWIVPGEFVMGSPEEIKKSGFLGFGGEVIQRGEVGRFTNEGPQTRVSLTRGYWLGRTPVTQGQWEILMGKNPSYFKGPRLPVEKVSWDDAMAFCHRLTEREQAAGRLPEGYVYTLPSEAQWEYAARAGTKMRWSFGDQDDRLGNYAWFKGNSDDQTHPVGQKRANPWGLYDVHGNVWEWTHSFSGNYPGGSVTDYEGPASGMNRVYRGGSWGSTADNARSAVRYGYPPGFRNSNLGFRLCLSPVR